MNNLLVMSGFHLRACVVQVSWLMCMGGPGKLVNVASVWILCDMLLVAVGACQHSGWGKVICVPVALPASTLANTPAEGNQRFHLRKCIREEEEHSGLAIN